MKMRTLTKKEIEQVSGGGIVVASRSGDGIIYGDRKPEKHARDGIIYGD